MIEGFQWGGQLMITSEVENYPGYTDGVLGPEMMRHFREQSERFGTEYVTDDVTRVDFSERPFKVYVEDTEYLAETVIVATGATARQLGLESERALQGRGVTYCATCDGAFYRDREVVVVGGGDSAMEEALFLTKFASKVTIVHRRDTFRASPIMVDRARAHEKIELLTPYVVEDVLGVDGQQADGRPAAQRRDRRAWSTIRQTGSSSRSATTRRRSSSSTGSTTTSPAISDAGQVDRDEHPGGLRGRRRAGPRLSPGRDGRRIGLSGGARRRALPRGARRRARGCADRSARADGACLTGRVAADTTE